MNSKVIGLTTLCLALALPLLAQGPRGSRERFGPPAGAHDGERTGSGERNPLGRLEEALALTPSQVASAEALFERHRAELEAFQTRTSSTRDAQMAAMDSGDPTAIGNAVLAARELRAERRAINEDFMAEFRSLLTLSQGDAFDAIKAFNRGALGRGDGPREGRDGRGRRGHRGGPGDLGGGDGNLQRPGGQ